MENHPVVPGEKFDRQRVTVMTLKKMKEEGKKVAALSIYDYEFARFADQAGLDLIILGDSLGMTKQGRKNTLPVTMDQMVYHGINVRQGTDNIFVVGDMPAGSYQASNEEGVRNAFRFIKEAGLESVKCEASIKLVPRVRAIADAEILVMGHTGLNPQKIHEMGGYRIQGKTEKSTTELLETALALQDAGVFALLLEGVTEEVAGLIHERLTIPVYGIGSGRYLDGQLMIGHDLLGLYSGFKKKPKYIREYRSPSSEGKTVGEYAFDAFSAYVGWVKGGDYPNEQEVHNLPPEEWVKIQGILRKKNLLPKKTSR